MRWMPRTRHRRACRVCYICSRTYGTLGASEVHTLPAKPRPAKPRPAKPGKATFSAIKAVKANARERLGTPPPERVLPDPKQKAAAEPKHKQTLADLLEKQEED